MQAATLKKILVWIMLGGLLLVAACANGGYQTYRPAYYPENRSYYPDYYGPSYYPDQDPQFWQMWQNSQGAGG